MMNRLSARLACLYTDLQRLDRAAAAARDGFTAIEHPEPWSVSADIMTEPLDRPGVRAGDFREG